VPPAFDIRTATVLVVEDDPQLRELHRTVLRDAGYAVVAVEDGLDALRYLESHAAPSAVVLDLALPRLGGHDVQREMAANGLTAPIIVVTGDPGTINENDFACVLRKPVTPAGLVRAVDNCIRQRR
jgi:CheY-like chemotaxis protein